MSLIYHATALAIRRIRTCKAAIPCPKCGTRSLLYSSLDESMRKIEELKK